MVNPLITIITPVHNEQDGIKRAIQSVVNQTYTNWEMIIINDASTDDTSKVVRELIKKDRRIRFEDLKNNVGGSAARNIGIKKARGEYVTFLDGDDEFLPNKLEEMLNFSLKGENKFCTVVADYFEESNNKLKRIIIPDVRNPILSLLTMEWHVASGSNLFIPKDLLNVIGLYSEKYPRHQDIEFLIRCLQKSKVAILHKQLTIIHGHKMQMGPKVTNNTLKVQKIIEAKLMLFSDFKEEINKLNSSDKKRVYAKNWLQISRLYAVDGNWKFSLEYLKMSLGYGIVFSNNFPFLPYVTYFAIPLYLIKASFKNLFKN
ncbi:MAG TPA: glycosyltransferase family 2 protein [Candidatus Dojkabacteria bacterium]|nr:glycosyltransferase family 2 protein [Candidatus Dojkabacteria bacterium]